MNGLIKKAKIYKTSYNVIIRDFYLQVIAIPIMVCFRRTVMLRYEKFFSEMSIVEMYFTVTRYR